MAVTALPDLNVLPSEALRALILAQHTELISTHEQLQSREREIEHLKLLLTKLHRMQFGRKSEKLQRQIEQLELRLEELAKVIRRNSVYGRTCGQSLLGRARAICCDVHCRTRCNPKACRNLDK